MPEHNGSDPRKEPRAGTSSVNGDRLQNLLGSTDDIVIIQDLKEVSVL
jgi:hypothetical protein